MTSLPAYYSSTPSANVSVNGIPIGEGMQRKDINDALRQIMADLKVWTDANGGASSITLGSLGGLSASYKELPQTTKSAGWTLALAEEAGHTYYTGSAATVTVPPNSTAAFPIGACIVLVNDGSGALTISRGAGVVMKWSSSGADANRTLAVGGEARLLKVGTDKWFINGAQLS